MEKLVSFVIPAYNAEKFIAESIESCLNQSYKNLEVIVVNDGSEDNTVEKVVELQKKFNNLILLDRPHEGKVATINQGVNLAKGEFIAIHAADDVCFEYRIEKQVDIFKESLDCVLVYGDYQVVDENLVPIDSSVTRKESSYPNNKNVFEELLYGNFMPGGTMLIKGELKDKIFPIPEELLFEDWWIALVSSFHGVIKKASLPLIKYRQHGSNDNAMFNVKDAHIKINKLKKDYNRHFKYYEEFQIFIKEHILDKKKSDKYMEIIAFNVLKKGFIVNSSFEERMELLEANKKNIFRMKMKDKIKLYTLLLAGDKLLHMRTSLVCSIKRVIDSNFYKRMRKGYANG